MKPPVAEALCAGFVSAEAAARRVKPGHRVFVGSEMRAAMRQGMVEHARPPLLVWFTRAADTRGVRARDWSPVERSAPCPLAVQPLAASPAAPG